MGKQTWSLVARILVIHLYRTLQQEIGLKWVISVGFGHFGTRVIHVEFRDLRSLPLKKNSVMACTTSAPSIDHVDLKNSTVYPSGPGALFEGNVLKMASISVLVGK